MSKIINITNQTTICTNAKIADTLFLKLKGLLGRKSLNQDEGLLIVGAKQIHSFFMQFPIDLIFLDKDKKVIKLYENFKPFSITKLILNSKYVLELPVGQIRKANVIKDNILIL